MAASMSASRTHLRAGDQHRSICGDSVLRTSSDWNAVNCKKCLKRMEGMPEPAADWSTEDVVKYVLAAICGPAVAPYPAADLRSEWSIMSCRAGAAVERCGCAFCAWERRWRGAVEEWQRNQPDRPHRRYEHPFGSVQAALSFWAWWQTGAGRTLRSSTGTAKARMEAVSKLGTEVQVTRRCDRDAIEITRAGQAVDIGRAVALCWSDEQRRRGLTTMQCTAALVRSLDATLGDAAHPATIALEIGVTEALMRALLGSAKREITIELAARGMIPEPRSKVGLGREIAARREAYERRVA